MCDMGMSLVAISVAMTAATTLSSMQAQSNAAKAQNDSNELQRGYIEQDRLNKQMQAGQQEGYANEAAYQKLDQNAQAARAARATATTAAGEAGVSGLSVDALQREFYARQGEYAQSVEENRSADIDRLQMQMKGFNVQAQSANNQLKQAAEPSFLDAALRIGGSAVGAYGKYMYVPGRSMGAGNTDVPINKSPTYPSRGADAPGGI
jgi:hypothetical protein